MIHQLAEAAERQTPTTLDMALETLYLTRRLAKEPAGEDDTVVYGA